MTLFKEIGSSYWLEPQQLKEPINKDFNFVYIQKNEDTLYTSSGRGAILLLLNQINQDPGRALLPLYTCESVIMSFLKKGYDVYFYDCNKDLTINEQSFIKSVKNHRPDIVFTHTYFGFDTLQQIRSRYQWLQNKGIAVIEDITHSLFSTFNKGNLQYYLASLRKWFALPDGGIAIVTDKKIKAKKYNTHEKVVSQNIKAISMKNEYTKNLDPELKNTYRKLFYSSEALLDNDCGTYAMSNTSKAILSNIDFKLLCNIRRNNYNYLFKHLIEHSYVTPVFNELPEQVVPLYLPVYVKGNRAKLQRYLADGEIYLPIHWPIPNVCIAHLTDSSSYIYDNILSIPCDQRYTHKDLKRIIKMLAKYSE